MIRTLIDAGTITAIGGAFAAVLGGAAKLVQALRDRRQGGCRCDCDCCTGREPVTVGG